MTFEQFMASILNENALVRAFETKIDVVQKLLDHERPAGTVGSFSTSSNAGTELIKICPFCHTGPEGILDDSLFFFLNK